ncbi:MAG: DUF1295 domain-containing protein [Proteobacteria bacterium]|nr:DUF1295 domain-containing protein [Pseudomonadota bacterium]
MSNKFKGILILFVTYAIAIACGVLSFGYFKDLIPIYDALFAANAIATIVTWLSGVIFKSASIYDPYWSVQTPVIMLGLMLMTSTFSPGILLFFAFLMFWAVRLTGNFIAGFHDISYVDWRYKLLKERSGRLFQLVNLLGICMFPTTVVYIASLPAIAYVLDGRDFELVNLIGLAIMLSGTLLELAADIQMKRFIKTRKDRSEIIRTGIWKYSRHPNYLGEILFWYGLALVYILPDVSRLPYIAGAVINHMMFLFISVPMAEGNMKKYKANFEQYKREVRMFLPIKRTKLSNR